MVQKSRERQKRPRLHFLPTVAIFIRRPLRDDTTYGPAMITLFALFRKPEEVQEFDKHFNESLIPLLRNVPGLQGLHVTRITGAALGESKYHVVAELQFNDRRTMDAALSSKEGKAVVRNIMSFAADLITVFFGEQIL
jgi:uncharacterized protein (TIGR02118 family)